MKALACFALTALSLTGIYKIEKNPDPHTMLYELILLPLAYVTAWGGCVLLNRLPMRRYSGSTSNTPQP